MDIRELREGWEHLGASDPLYGVLTDPIRAGGRWEPADFLATGETEVATVFAWLRRFELRSDPLGRALDFGCGAGRLSQALARRYEKVDGVDISASMLDAAVRLEPPDNVTFHHNTTDDLSLFDDGTFDFVYSSIVLQHMPSIIALRYIREFVRVTRPGGLVVFQAPDEYRPVPITFAERVSRFRVRLALRTRLRGKRPTDTHSDATMRTLAAHATPMDDVLAALADSGAHLIDIAATNSLDQDFNGQLVCSISSPPHGWVSRQYTALVGE